MFMAWSRPEWLTVYMGVSRPLRIACTDRYLVVCQFSNDVLVRYDTEFTIPKGKLLG